MVRGLLYPACVRRLATLLALTIAAVLGGVAHGQRASRFFVLTSELTRRLTPEVAASLRSVARLGSGLHATGFLVDGTAGVDAHGALITNEHVTVSSQAGEPMRFHDGQEGRVLGTILASRRYDYRVLRVRLPAASSARAAPLRRGAVATGEAVYAFSAGAHPFGIGADRSGVLTMEPLDEAFLAQAEAAHSGLWTLQFGAEQGNGYLHAVPTWDRQVFSLSFGLPNAPGTSGSPVFSADRHDVVGVHWGGFATPPHWRSSAVASHDILTDLEARLAAGEVTGADADAIRRVLAGASKP